MDVSRDSQHFAILYRSSTGSRLHHRMSRDEIELLGPHNELLKRLLENYYDNFEVEYFEQVGVKKNESDS